MKNTIRERIAQYILIFLFVFLLFLPIADNLFRIFPDTELLENRPLVAFTTITEGNIQSFPTNFENYYNDNFGLRKYLIKANNILYIKLLSFSPNRMVVLGMDDWLYLAGKDEAIFRYKQKHTEEELKLYFDILKKRKDFFEKEDIQYFIIIAPNKQSLYPEYMPEYIQRLNENSEYDQITEYLSKNSLDVNIDVKKALFKEKMKGKLVYYKTDTHWNNYAAFIAYQEIMKKFEIYYPELKPVPLTDFNISEKQYSGDLAKMLGMEEYFNENVPNFIPKNVRKANFEKINSVDGIATKSPMLLSECKSCSNITSVIIRDSQAEPLIPFLAEHFSRIVYIPEAEDPAIIHAIIKNEKPNIVLFERVERGMNTIFYQNPNISLINITDSIVE